MQLPGDYIKGAAGAGALTAQAAAKGAHFNTLDVKALEQCPSLDFVLRGGAVGSGLDPVEGVVGVGGGLVPGVGVRSMRRPDDHGHGADPTDRRPGRRARG